MRSVAHSVIAAASAVASGAARLFAPEPRDPSQSDDESTRELENEIYGLMLDVDGAFAEARFHVDQQRVAERDGDDHEAMRSQGEANKAVQGGFGVLDDLEALIRRSRRKLESDVTAAATSVVEDYRRGAQQLRPEQVVRPDSVQEYATVVRRGVST